MLKCPNCKNKVSWLVFWLKDNQCKACHKYVSVPLGVNIAIAGLGFSIGALVEYVSIKFILTLTAICSLLIFFVVPFTLVAKDKKGVVDDL